MQFLRATLLLMVTWTRSLRRSYGIFSSFATPPPAELDLWVEGRDIQLAQYSSLGTASYRKSCMLHARVSPRLVGFGKETARNRAASVVLIAAALASAFGLSVFVTFAFFLVMAAWALWQLLIERTPRPTFLLAAGGAGATVLADSPTFGSLPTHQVRYARLPASFGFGIREMIPPDGLMASGIFQHFAAGHPFASLNVAKLILLVPGYAVELGFFFHCPAHLSRSGMARTNASSILNSAHLYSSSLPLLAFVSLIRSGVLQSNDFGWRGSLILQFPLLLLASEVVTSWSLAETQKSESGAIGLHQNMPRWLRCSLAALTLVIGALGIAYQGLMLAGFITLLGEARMSADYDPRVRSFSHNAYISLIGYDHLPDAAIPRDAVVQFNPIHQEPFWIAADLLGVDHQTAIMSDPTLVRLRAWHGDSSGCIEMSGPIDAIFNGETAQKARTQHLQSIRYPVSCRSHIRSAMER